MKKYFFTLILLLRTLSAEVIVPVDAVGWSYFRALDENGNQISPGEFINPLEVVGEPNFIYSLLWPIHFSESYSPFRRIFEDSYNESYPFFKRGPGFTMGGTAPFSQGGVEGIQGGTDLSIATGNDWNVVWFIRKVDGGGLGYDRLKLTLLAHDAAIVFLNGDVVARKNLSANFDPQVWQENPLKDGDENLFEEVVLAGEVPGPYKILPGPDNLLAIAVYRKPGGDDFGFKLQLEGESADEIEPRGPVYSSEEGELIVTWMTSEIGNSSLEYSSSAVEIQDGTLSLDSETRFHRYLIPNVFAGARYELDFTGPTGQMLNYQYDVPRRTVLAAYSSDWSYFQIFQGGQTVDPQTDDTDFYGTWMNQSLGGFTGDGAYDGPVFSLDGIGPLSTRDPEGGDQTMLATPFGGDYHAVWMLKVVDGGENGFSDLKIEGNVESGAYFYLNGKRIGTVNVGEGSSDRWARNALDSSNGHVDLSIDRVLRPGPNLFAVSVHSAGAAHKNVGGSLSITGVNYLPEVYRVVVSNVAESSARISWETRNIEVGMVKYGIEGEPILFANTVVGFEHLVDLSNLSPKSTYQFEILDSEGHSYTPPEVGTFSTTPEVVIPRGSGGWHYLHSLDEIGDGVDPILLDLDFQETWTNLLEPGSSYDGPSFVNDGKMPIGFGDFVQEQGSTFLTEPNSSTGEAFWLVKEFEVGKAVYTDLELRLRGSGGAIIYLNGESVGSASFNSTRRNHWEESRIELGDQVLLRPGRNTIAILVYSNSTNYWSQGIDLALMGNRQDIALFNIEETYVAEGEIKLSWQSSFDDDLTVRWGTEVDQLDQELVVTRLNSLESFVQFSDVQQGQRYFYEILKSSGEIYDPPARGSFQVGESPTGPLSNNILFSNAEGWSVLYSIDAVNRMHDPALGDADFHQTWFAQSLGSYVGNGLYDGPVFQSGIRAPVHYGLSNTPGTTLLPPPDTPHIGPIWMIKEIDGGLTGYHNLIVNVAALDGAVIYLNGARIGEKNMPRNGEDRFGTLALEKNEFWSNVPIAKNVSILPGPNLLAISIHPHSLQVGRSYGTAYLVGYEGLAPGRYAWSSPRGGAFDLHWRSEEVEASRVRFGKSPFEMTELLNDDNLVNDHLVQFPEIGADESYYYEILQENGDSFDPPFIGTTGSGSGSAEVPFLSLEDALVRWNTDWPSQATVSYGKWGTEPEFVTVLDQGFLNNHEILLSNLESGDTYYVLIEAIGKDGQTEMIRAEFLTGEVVRGPYLQKAHSSGVTVHWRTSIPMGTWLAYGTDPDDLDQIISTADLVTEHSAEILGLNSESLYHYRILSSLPSGVVNAFEGCSFKTAPEAGISKPTRIWAIGDSGGANQGAREVYKAFESYTVGRNPDLWLMLGDNAYEIGTDEEYQKAVFDMYPELLKRSPLWATRGNHDYTNTAYLDVFDFPSNGEAGGVASGTEEFYSFDHGNIHFICLNSTTFPEGMKEWLELDLMECRSDWIIAFFHHGAYTFGSHNSDQEQEHIVMREQILPLLEDFGVDLILSGHSHSYERSKLLDGHYGFSSSFDEAKHALDSGNGSINGSVDRDTGRYQWLGGTGPYKKRSGRAHEGQVSVIAGASSYLSSRGGLNHPVMVNSLRVLGSMVIDVDGLTLHARYLDNNGVVRDDFTIQKEWPDSPAMSWWEEHFGDGSRPYLSDWRGDPDGDNVDNLMEYALGTNPSFPGRNVLENYATEESIILRYPRFLEKNDLTFEIEMSSDLETFLSSPLILNEMIQEADPSGLEWWEARLPISAESDKYMRLKIERK